MERTRRFYERSLERVKQVYEKGQRQMAQDMREVELIADQQRAKLQAAMGLGMQQALEGIDETLARFDLEKTTPRGERLVPALALRSASSEEDS